MARHLSTRSSSSGSVHKFHKLSRSHTLPGNTPREKVEDPETPRRFTDIGLSTNYMASSSESTTTQRQGTSSADNDPATSNQPPPSSASGDLEAQKKKPKRRKAWGEICKEILFTSYANVLLVFIPVGIGLHFASVSPVAIFVTNFLAIVPLAAVFPIR
jgi:hypothetical protein